MFTAKQIKEMMNAQPFKPFRIHLSDGSVHEVPNHDAAIVAHSSVEVATGLDTDGIAEWSTRCAIIHITRIEDLQPA